MIRTRTTLSAVAALLLALTGCGGATTTAGAEPSASPTRSTPALLPTITTPPPPAYTPKPTEFQLTVKILKKQCFGSAGCNVTYRIEVGYDGFTLDPSDTYEVTYEVRGLDDPAINTFELTGDQVSVQEEEMGQTPRSSTKLTAKVTSVSLA